VLTARKAFPTEEIVVATDYTEWELFPAIRGTNQMDGVKIANRPPEICRDDTTSEVVVKWILAQRPSEEAFVLLQPTSPRREPKTLSKARKTFDEGQLTSLVSVNPAYQPNGNFYFCNSRAFDHHGSWWSYATSIWVQSWEESVDVNYVYDLAVAEALRWNRVYREVS